MKKRTKIFLSALALSATLSFSSCGILDSLLGSKALQIEKLRIYYNGEEVGAYDETYGITTYDIGDFTYSQAINVEESLFEIDAVLSDGSVVDVTNHEKTEKYYEYTSLESYLGEDTKVTLTEFIPEKPVAGNYTLRYRWWANNTSSSEALITYTVNPFDVSTVKPTMYDSNNAKITTWEQGSAISVCLDTLDITKKEYIPILLRESDYPLYQALATIEEKEAFILAQEHWIPIFEPTEECDFISGNYYLGVMVNDEHYEDGSLLCSKNYSGISDFILIRITNDV